MNLPVARHKAFSLVAVMDLNQRGKPIIIGGEQKTN
jgi:hypothetical protein